MLILLILSLGTLPPPAVGQDLPTGSAEPALCFPGHDPSPGTAAADGSTNACPGGLARTPNLLQGDAISIRVENLRSEAAQASEPWVSVRCATSCYDEENDGNRIENKLYWARWKGFTLIFPRDFHERGPDGFAPSATDDKAPRYNGTWEVEVLLSGQPPLKRDFNVWLFTRYRSTNLTVEPGEMHTFRSSGLEATSTLVFKIERKTQTGLWTPIPLQPAPATKPTAGSFTYTWNVPPEEATRIADCPLDTRDCYRAIFRASDSTKREEVVPFSVRTATAKVDPGPDGEDPQRKVRSQVVVAYAQLRYPAGAAGFGPIITASHLSTEANRTPTIRARVERDNRTTEPTVLVDTFPLKYDIRTLRWEGTWTVPKDFTLYPQALYRIRLPETRDAWGNLIPATDLINVTIDAALIEPRIATQPTLLPRTNAGVVALTVKYLNGTPIFPEDLKTPLRGCFVRDQGTGTYPCTNSSNTNVQVGAYSNGAWRFTKVYPKDYAELGSHRFVLLQDTDTQDRWGNRINTTLSAPIEVIAGSPQIEFTTVMRERATSELERGQSIWLTAIVTYADGTPYNSTLRPNFPPAIDARYLTVNVTKRGLDGSTHSIVPVNLTQANYDRGIWQGLLPLTLDDATPVGRWTFELDIRDNATVPNTNLTSFDRTIVPAALRYTPGPISNALPATGATIEFGFTLQYPQGQVVTANDVASDGLRAYVYKYDPKTKRHTGTPFADLTPQWSAPGFPGQWSLRYKVAPELFNGSYVIHVTGSDKNGNRLPSDAYSREFTPHSEIVDRAVISPLAPVSVKRGEIATALFAAEENDLGLDGLGKPKIEVQRWNDGGRRWDPIATAPDVRVETEDPFNHAGEFPVTSTTPIGTYRFHFIGRDSRLRIVEAYAPNFTVEPTDATRSFLQLPPPLATKGDLIWFTVEAFPGDQYRSIRIHERGQPIPTASPGTSYEGDRLNVTWKIPFEMATGNHTIVLEGYDRWGNRIRLESPSIETRGTQLQGRIVGNPEKTIARGTSATLLFGITFPGGGVYRENVLPTVYVMDANGRVARAQVAARDLVYEAAWRPDTSTPLADYWFEVGGAGPAGNTFPTLRSSTFRVEPGVVTRASPNRVFADNERLGRTGWLLPVNPDDKAVTFTLDYYGQGSDYERATSGVTPVTSTPMTHVINTDEQVYVVVFATTATTPVGTYRMRMEGEDRHGNAIEAFSNPFTLKTTTIVVAWKSMPAEADFKEGLDMDLTFTMSYRNGALVPADQGRPTVRLLLGRAPANPEPTLEYAESEGVWHVKWKVPDTLVPGMYTFTVSGFDAASNAIATAKSSEYRYTASVPESFAKEVPGAGVPLVLLAIVALALLVRRRPAS